MERPSVEVRLADFRARKLQKKQTISEVTATFSRHFDTLRNAISSPSVVDENNMSTIPLEDDEEQQVTEEKSPPPKNQIISRILLVLKVVLWLVMWGLSIEVGFGAVFFIASSLVLIYKNTRTGPKKKDAPSAYSVFNPNCERLDGTFTAEQFEKELGYGSLK